MNLGPVSLDPADIDPAALAEELDAISVDTLRKRGSVKWSPEGGEDGPYGGDLIGAFVAEMDFGTAPAVTQALHAAVDAALFGYLPAALVRSMAEACARWQRERYGWQVSADDVHPLPDVVQAFELAITHFSRPGSPVILPTPAYMPFLTVPGAHGRDVIQVPMVRDGGRMVMDLDGIDRAFRAGGHLLVLCNPCNPVGRVFTRDEMTAIAEVVDRHGGRVFSDEIHAPLVYPGHRHVPYASISPVTAGHTITATSASKAWNIPGLKCAQMIVSNPADARTWAQVGETAAFGVSNLGAVAHIAAYTHGGPWLDAILGYLDRNRRALADLLAAHLPQVGYTPPEGTYLALLDFRRTGIGDLPAAFLAERAGVVLTEGLRCGEAGRGHARLNFATPLPILETIVTRMARAVAEHGRG